MSQISLTLQRYSQSRRLLGSRPFHWFAWYNSCGTEKCPLAVNGSHQQEGPLDTVLYGGRLYGGFVNRAVSYIQVSISVNSVIHKAAGSLVTGCSLQNRKMSVGNSCTEWFPKAVLYGGRQSSSFVNSAVTTGHSQKAAGWNTPPPPGHSCWQLPFTAYRTFFSGMVEQWNCTSQIME